MDVKDSSKLKQTISKSRSEEAVHSATKCQISKPEKDVRFAATPTEIVLDKPYSDKEANRAKPSSKSGETSRDFPGESRGGGSGSPKVSRKYFTNWRQACDKTKDRTKELLKRWRTLPETDILDEFGVKDPHIDDKMSKGQGWSVHVWSEYEN